jgi:hypothetical protein
MTDKGPSAGEVWRTLGRRAGETAAGWLERLPATDVSGLKTERKRYQLLVAVAEQQARREAGKRPLKPRTIAEQMVAAAGEVGTGEGVGAEKIKVGGDLEKIVVDKVEKINLAGTKMGLRGAAPRGKGKR